MIDPDQIRSVLHGTDFQDCTDYLVNTSLDILKSRPHGDRQKWLQQISLLPDIEKGQVELDRSAITASPRRDLDDETKDSLRSKLMALHPWRKGPFNLFGVEIDAEWRSNLKWARIMDKIAPVKDRSILDVGCGNGYYLWRMQGAGARLAVGIDPTQLFLAQFIAVNRYLKSDRIVMLPLRSEELFAKHCQPRKIVFDTVFSMGIYYHRRYPLDHLSELYRFLRPGGQLVLETLVFDGDFQDQSRLDRRYAKMRNVWCIPTVSNLRKQLLGCGFQNPQLIDLTKTSEFEQRRTPWMTFESLADFLDPTNPDLTIEGYPAPLRACVIADRSVG